MDARNLPKMPEMMIVGPGELHDEDLAVLGEQMIAHYGGTWVVLHNQLIDDLGTLLGAADPPYVIPGTGTTSLDAVVLNLFEPGQRVVVANTGFFGARLVEVATVHGLQVTEITVEVGAPIDVDALAAAARGADGVITVHVETSTGVRHPIDEIASAANAAGAAYIVDGIASVGGELVDVDALGLAALITGTQKGLEGPPGLGIIALGARGRARMAARSEPVRSWYLDLSRWDWYRREWAWHPHPVTMPVSLMRATSSSVSRILEMGLESWVGARAVLCRRLREGLASIGFEPVPRADVQSNMVVAVWADDAPAIQKHLLGQGLQISGGLAPLAGKTLRIGLMGRTATEAMVDRVIDAVALARKETAV